MQYEIGAQGSLFSNRLSAQASLFDLENTDAGPADVDRGPANVSENA